MKILKLAVAAGALATTIGVSTVSANLIEHNLTFDLGLSGVPEPTATVIQYRTLPVVVPEQFHTILITCIGPDRIFALSARVDDFPGHVNVVIQETHDAWVSYSGVADRPSG